jgi:hypothetical protein
MLQLGENPTDPKRRPPRKGRHDPRSGRNGRSRHVAQTHGAKSNSLPQPLDKSRINGLKGPPGPLVVMGQTETPPRGSETMGGQAPCDALRIHQIKSRARVLC